MIKIAHVPIYLKRYGLFKTLQFTYRNKAKFR